MTGPAADPASFLERHGLGTAARRPLAGDASARRYERVSDAGGTTRILVATPDPAGDLVPFIAIGGLLDRLGFSVPRVLVADTATGLALLEDFGDDTFSRLAGAGDEDAEALYALATDVLAELHGRFRPEHAAGLALPVYDAGLFLDQVMLFADVYPAAVGCPLSQTARRDLEAAWRAVLPAACAGPVSLLLRDYHTDNLMRLDRPGVRAAGLLDFQNAGVGPVAYDLVSLLEDARRDVPDDRAERMIARYLSARPECDPAAFRRSCAVLGAVRHARVLAIFVRLAGQGKPAYLAHLPRVRRLLDRRLRQPALAPVADWFDRHLPPHLRADFVIPEPTQ
ncbi:aminoglycoside phosphotransferase family protein [Azospirillum halopraeferens]|uniref:aminoglycoside phosphotransferase family protein n=1 Tax=Azospirillum halopraeferens TaxID=34010 RepID=UPI0004129451|nr:phosphotransferase [Azospirillum halopraeferens]